MERPKFRRTIIVKDGKVWEFLIWHGFVEGIHTQKLFFWNKDKSIAGFLELKDENTIHIKKLRDRMKKIANNKTFRDNYLSELKFPVEKKLLLT